MIILLLEGKYETLSPMFQRRPFCGASVPVGRQILCQLTDEASSKWQGKDVMLEAIEEQPDLQMQTSRAMRAVCQEAVHILRAYVAMPLNDLRDIKNFHYLPKSLRDRKWSVGYMEVVMYLQSPVQAAANYSYLMMRYTDRLSFKFACSSVQLHLCSTSLCTRSLEPCTVWGLRQKIKS